MSWFRKRDLHTQALDTILEAQLLILKELKKIMSTLDQLTADVAAEDSAVDSAVVLLQGLKAALDAAGTDPAKLAALSADIQAKTKVLSDAVVANTPAAPAPSA